MPRTSTSSFPPPPRPYPLPSLPPRRLNCLQRPALLTPSLEPTPFPWPSVLLDLAQQPSRSWYFSLDPSFLLTTVPFISKAFRQSREAFSVLTASSLSSATLQSSSHLHPTTCTQIFFGKVVTDFHKIKPGAQFSSVSNPAVSVNPPLPPSWRHFLPLASWQRLLVVFLSQ